MSKINQFFKRLFPPGKMPEETKDQLEQEGLLYFAEKIRVTVVFRNFKAKGRRYSYRRSLTLGSLALTELRIVGLSLTKTILNVPYNYPQFSELNFFILKNRYLCASFDVSVFNPEQSGKVELRFNLPDPDQVIKIIDNKKDPE